VHSSLISADHLPSLVSSLLLLLLFILPLVDLLSSFSLSVIILVQFISLHATRFPSGLS
jgi:hypothetical protein